jgi:ubiquinone/menaquinone biosynthesis C-methylase UbiE
MDVAAPGNADQVEYWNGDVGQRWARNQDRMDRVFQPLTTALIERAAPRRGERAADIGCGCGDLSLMLADRVGAEGRVLAVDVSRPMLDRGRARQQALAGAGRAVIDWQEADAAAWPFPEGAFDLLASRFGVMFFADPLAAFRNMRRALRSGGRLAMLCWQPMQDNAWVAVPRTAMLQVLPAPEPMPPHAPGPFAFADAARVGAILAQAGFVEVASARVAAALDTSAPGSTDAAALDDAVQFAIEAGPASALLRDIDDAMRDRAIAAVRAALRDRAGAGRASLDAACWLFTAENPAAAEGAP